MPKTKDNIQTQGQGASENTDHFEISIETFEDEKLDESVVQKSASKKVKNEVYEELEQSTNRSEIVQQLQESSDSITPKSSFEKSVCAEPAAIQLPEKALKLEESAEENEIQMQKAMEKQMTKEELVRKKKEELAKLKQKFQKK